MATIPPVHSKNVSSETHRDDASQRTSADSAEQSVTTVASDVFWSDSTTSRPLVPTPLWKIQKENEAWKKRCEKELKKEWDEIKKKWDENPYPPPFSSTEENEEWKKKWRQGFWKKWDEICKGGGVNAPPASSRRKSEVDPFDRLTQALQWVYLFRVKELLALRPPIDLKRLNAEGFTPLGIAIIALRRPSLPVYKWNEEGPVVWSPKEGPDIIKELLKSGADVHQIDQQRNTALTHAIAVGVHVMTAEEQKIVQEVVDILLTHGADPNQMDKEGNTALIHAIVTGQQDLVDILLTHGADPNKKNRNEETPLIVACKRGKLLLPIVETLLMRGDVDPNVRTHGQYSARGLAFLDEQSDLSPILPADPFMDEYAARQRLAYVFGSNSISELRSDFPTSLQPAYTQRAYLYLAKHLKNFLRDVALGSFLLSPQSEASLVNAFERLEGGAYCTLTELLSEAAKGKLVILPAGSNHHSIAIVFCYGYMILCNRQTDGVYPTLTCFPIDSSKITESISQQINGCINEELDSATSILYKTIPAQLSRHTEVPLHLMSLDDDMAFPRQTAKNCSYASAEASFRASLLLLAMQKGNSPLLNNGDIRKEVLHTSKEFSLFICMEELSFYLQFYLQQYPPNEVPHDPQLIQSCLEEIQNKYEEEEHWSAPIQEKFQKLKTTLLSPALEHPLMGQLYEKVRELEEKTKNPKYKKLCSHLANLLLHRGICTFGTTGEELQIMSYLKCQIQKLDEKGDHNLEYVKWCLLEMAPCIDQVVQQKYPAIRTATFFPSITQVVHDLLQNNHLDAACAILRIIKGSSSA